MILGADVIKSGGIEVTVDGNDFLARVAKIDR